MSVAPQIGPRAALLLGMLSSGAKTEEELLAIIDRAASPSSGMVFGTTRLAARDLSDGGIGAITLALGRLAELDWVRPIPDPEGGNLWVATAPESLSQKD